MEIEMIVPTDAELAVIFDKHDKYLKLLPNGAKADFTGYDLSNRTLSDKPLAAVSFANGKCTGTKFIRCVLNNSVFTDCTMDGTTEFIDSPLCRVTGNGYEIVSLQLGALNVVVTKNKTYFGCTEVNTIDAYNFTEEQAAGVFPGEVNVIWRATYRQLVTDAIVAGGFV